MKKIISLALILCLLLSLAVSVSAAGAGTPYAVTGGNIYFDPATGTVTGCDSSVTAADIPASINGAAVKSIGKNAFIKAPGLKSVRLPEGLTEIGSAVFYGCHELEEAKIPSSLKIIGDYAFYSCAALKEISLPEGLTKIGSFAFHGDESLTSVRIPDSVTELGSHVFAHCYGLKEVYIPANFYRLDKNLFSNCTSLESVVIPEGVRVIEDSAFAACFALKSVSFPKGLTNLGNNAFSNCRSLESVIIPDSVVDMGSRCFAECAALKEVSLPKRLSSIPEKLFHKCTSLGEIVLPPDIIGIGDEAFAFCPIEEIEIPEGVYSLGAAFAYCENLKAVYLPESVEHVGERAFNYCYGLLHVSMPGVKSIGGQAFYRCDSLQSVELGSALNIVRSNIALNRLSGPNYAAFRDCDNLETVYFNGSKADWAEVDFTEGNEALTGAKILFAGEWSGPIVPGEPSQPEAPEEPEKPAEPSVRNEKVTITYRGIRILLDGKQIAPVDEQGKSTEPFILGGSTYLPVRSIAGALGLEVGWDAAASSIVLTSGGKASEGGSPAASHLSKEVTVTYRGTKLILDGKQIALVNANGDSVEPFIYEGSNYLPLRVVGEALGLRVGWDAATSTVSLLSEGTELSRVTETLAMDKAGEMLLSTRETITVSRPDSIRTTVYEGGGAKTESIQYLDSEGQPLSAEHYDAEGELCATELWEREGDYLHYTRDDLRDDNADCYIRYYYRDGQLHSAREYGGSTLSKVHSIDHDYDYDEAGRLIRHYIHIPDASWEEILYSYDGDGNLLRMQGEAYDIHTNGFGRYYIEYFYEDGVLVKSESTGGCVTEYFYGSGGELVKTVSENPDGSYLIRQYK